MTRLLARRAHAAWLSLHKLTNLRYTHMQNDLLVLKPSLGRVHFVCNDTAVGMYSTRILVALFVAVLHLCAVHALYQGDMILTPEQQRTIEATSNPNDPFSPQNAVVRNMRALWPNAMVPFIIDSSLGNYTMIIL